MIECELQPPKTLDLAVPLELQEQVRNNMMPKVLLTTRLQIVNLSNTVMLVYKLKTNSPKSYKVVPTQGVIAAGKSAFVEITLIPHMENDFTKNKFQVLLNPAGGLALNESAESLTQYWGTTKPAVQKRLGIRFNLSGEAQEQVQGSEIVDNAPDAVDQSDLAQSMMTVQPNLEEAQVDQLKENAMAMVGQHLQEDAIKAKTMKDRVQSQKIVPENQQLLEELTQYAAAQKLEYESAPGQEINKEEEKKPEEPKDVFQSVMPEPEKEQEKLNRMSMMTAKNVPQDTAASEQSSAVNTNTLHVPFIQQRISDIKDDIEKEKLKQTQIQRKIDALTRRDNSKDTANTWQQVSTDTKGKNSGFTIVQVFAIAVLFLILGNRLAC